MSLPDGGPRVALRGLPLEEWTGPARLLVNGGADQHLRRSRRRSEVHLGALKGNVGNQNYEVPEDVDLSQYRSVVIYCVPLPCGLQHG